MANCNNTQMSNYSKQIERRQEAKEKDKTSRETLGKFFYDLAKIVFGTMTLVGAVSLITGEQSIDNIILLILGIVSTSILAAIGYKVINSKK